MATTQAAWQDTVRYMDGCKRRHVVRSTIAKKAARRHHATARNLANPLDGIAARIG